MKPNAILHFTAALSMLSSGGCVTSRERERPIVLVSADGGAELADRPSGAEVEQLATRMRSHADAGRDACVRALVEASPDLALELVRRSVRTGELAVASRVAAGLSPDEGAAIAATCDASRRAPSEHRIALDRLDAARAALRTRDLERAATLANEARDLLARLGDPIGLEDAEQLMALAREATFTAARAPTRGQAITRSLTTALDTTTLREVLELARASRDWTALEAAERARQTIEAKSPLQPADARAWLDHLATIALERGRPLAAIQAALELERRGGADVRAKLLRARAQVASGQPQLALELALGVAAECEGRGERANEGRALALAGEALAALDRHDDAAGAYRRSAQLARDLGDQDGWARRAMNLARTHLRRNDPAAARAELERLEQVRGLAPGLAGRVAITRALEKAWRGEHREARELLEKALASLARAGDADGVERAQNALSRLEG